MKHLHKAQVSFIFAAIVWCMGQGCAMRMRPHCIKLNKDLTWNGRTMLDANRDATHVCDGKKWRKVGP